MSLPSSAVAKTHVSVADYLAGEYHGERKHEYRNGEVVAMAGGNRWHERMMKNVLFGAYSQQEQTQRQDCELFLSEMMVFIPACQMYTYPDLSLVCGEPQFSKNQFGIAVLLNPQVVVEVLSPTTELHDRSEKLRCYQQLESLQQYVLVAHDQPLVESYSRQEDGWLQQSFSEGAFSLGPFSISVKQVYAGVSFSEE